VSSTVSDNCWLATGEASGQENLAPILLYSTWNTKEMGGVQPVLLRGQPQTAARSSRHYEGYRPDALQEAGEGMGEYF